MEIVAKKNVVAHTIQTSFDKLQQSLDKQENEPLVEVLKLQDNKAMSTHAGIRNQIQREREEYSRTRMINKLVEEAEIEVEVMPFGQHGCKEGTSLFRMVCAQLRMV